MSGRSSHNNLLPAVFVVEARAQTRDQFLAAWGDTQFLLIRIENVSSDLAQGLAAASTLTGERLRPTHDSLAFVTAMDDSGALLSSPPSRRSELPGSPYDRTRLETQLLRTPHFLAPLRKRPIAGKPFVDRISVGRAYNNDIVLRQGGVSKFHAWLECDDGRQFYIGDARSSNGTTLNGKAVTSQLVPLKAGDEIRFGQVQATLCPPELLWDVISR